MERTVRCATVDGRLVAGLLFLSGWGSLVLQVAWMREFRLVFGASTAASAAVVAIFMGGLGLGSALLGSRGSSGQSVALVRGLGVGDLSDGRAEPLGDCPGVPHCTPRLGGQMVLGLAGATLARLLGAAAVLAVPTVLMGGTLPAAVRAVTDPRDHSRRWVAILYAANTLGAVAGAAVGTFWLLAAAGTRATIWIACLVELSAFAGRLGPVATRTAVVPPGDRRRAICGARRSGSRRSTAAYHPRAGGAAVVRSLDLRVRGGRGVRVLPDGTGLVPHARADSRGHNVHLRAVVGRGPVRDRTGGRALRPGLPTPATHAWHLRVHLRLEAVCIAIPFALGDRVAIQAALWAERSTTFVQSVADWTWIAAAVVFPAALISGVQYPILVALLGEGRHRIGTQVGWCAAWNTVGAIAGSLAGGFGALPLLTAPGAWRLVVSLLAATGLAAAILAARGAPVRTGRDWWGRARPLGLPLATGAVAVALILSRTDRSLAAQRRGGGAVHPARGPHAQRAAGLDARTPPPNDLGSGWGGGQYRPGRR